MRRGVWKTSELGRKGGRQEVGEMVGGVVR